MRVINRIENVLSNFPPQRQVVLAEEILKRAKERSDEQRAIWVEMATTDEDIDAGS